MDADVNADLIEARAHVDALIAMLRKLVELHPPAPSAPDYRVRRETWSEAEALLTGFAQPAADSDAAASEPTKKAPPVSTRTSAGERSS